MTVVFKASEKLQEKMIAYYADKRREKTPPYAKFQAMDADTIVTLYESGKVMFQGISADLDANLWIDIEKNLTGISINLNENEKKKAKQDKMKQNLYSIESIGSDEVGTGDYFGPIVVTASYVSKDQIQKLDQLGVKDSKKLLDDKINAIAPILIKEVDHATYILNNHEYNDYQRRGYNMNKIKAILHNKVLLEMKKKHPNCQKIVVDQFVYEKKYYEHIKEEKEIVNDITFYTRAESICPSVAVSSCISRYIFLQKMDELSDELHIPLLKSSGEDVDRLAAEIVKKYGKQKLESIAKLNFKNTEKLNDYL